MAHDPPSTSSQEFAAFAYDALPIEADYAYHKALSTESVHKPYRVADAVASESEMAIADTGWTIVIPQNCPPLIQHTANDLQEHLQRSMQVNASIKSQANLKNWESLKNSIIIATASDIPALGKSLKQSKDYRLLARPNLIVVCGYDDRGAMFGTYHLEDRLNLRGGPFLPNDLDVTRHSLYQTRMVLNWMGWMEWPDSYLSQIAHDGFDGIFASVYANPNALEGPPHYDRIRNQNPAVLKNVVARASKQGLKVYAPLLFGYTGEPDNEQALREHVRDVVTQFPEIHGYILLTEGFMYGKFFGAGGHGSTDLKEWAKHWTRAVAIVAEECHKINPDIEVLPWEYNVDFRPDKADLKRYVLGLLPQETIPLVTWENGKSFKLGEFEGYLRDYSINEVGPAEVTFAQVDEANKRGMTIYSKVDTFASWQFGTTPYIPAPYQWAKRYAALEQAGIDGTLETWSNGYKPNFMADVRAWSCWSDAPELDVTLRNIARRDFGAGNEDLVLDAWKSFSEAITLVPDTGPTMGTNQAIANPLFFEDPHPRMASFNHSWLDKAVWQNNLTGSKVDPRWPYTVQRMIFIPDFTNKTNKAESYARSVSGVARLSDGSALAETQVLPTFVNRLQQAADKLETGLVSYRKAARQAPEAKRSGAIREVLVVEQMQRMLRSLQSLLEFENLRLQLHATEDVRAQTDLLAEMETILDAEIARTEHALETARRDSRLGYEFEQDYVYRPYVLEEKQRVLHDTKDRLFPEFRKTLKPETTKPTGS